MRLIAIQLREPFPAVRKRSTPVHLLLVLPMILVQLILIAPPHHAFHFSYFQKNTQRSTLALLWNQQQDNPQRSQKKRFAQVHQNRMVQKKSSQNQQRPVDQQIEELEEKLRQRWGTELSVWTRQDHDDDDDDDAMYERVVAPGPKQDSSRKGSAKATPSFEYYDADDEGYENKNSQSSESSWNFRHLLKPEPEKGQGTFATKNETTPSRTPVNETPPTRSQGEDSKPRQNNPMAAPKIDPQTNQPMFLTLEQAKRQQQSMLSSSNTNDGDEDSSHDASPSSWQSLGIEHPQLLQNLRKMECQEPLPVQKQSIPHILSNSNEDLVIGTYTGSGKTMAFMLPIIQQQLSLLSNAHNRNNKNVQAIVVAPGRELASQIVSVTRELLLEMDKNNDVSVMLAIGGTTFSRNWQQIRQRKPSILVGTPGRLAEIIVGQPGQKSGKLKINDVCTLVLDEFDALLQYKVHCEPTQAILKTLQGKNTNMQTIVCSATASDMSSKLKDFLRPGYKCISVDANDAGVIPLTKGSSSSPSSQIRVSRTVIHGMVHVPHRRLALDTLRRILHTDPIPQQILIFAENARKVDIVVEKLQGMGIVAAALHGGMGSEKMDRAEVSKALREGYVGIVVATELAARGLDAPLLTHVINLDLPTDASHYAHRAGRCGRGGRPGVVINLTTNPKERNVPSRFAETLGIDIHTVEVRNGKLNIVEPDEIVVPPRQL